MRRLALALLLGACRPPDTAKMEPDKLVLGECGGPALLVLLGPPVHQVEGRRAPLPVGYAEGERLFAEAVAGFEKRAYREAAHGFMDAASHFAGGAPEYQATLGANRVVAYRNAALAWEAAGNLEEARRELGARAASDPDCAAAIGRIVGGLVTSSCKPSPP